MGLWRLRHEAPLSQRWDEVRLFQKGKRDKTEMVEYGERVREGEDQRVEGEERHRDRQTIYFKVDLSTHSSTHVWDVWDILPKYNQNKVALKAL